jgi:alkylhydroperoxidase family enzyme
MPRLRQVPRREVDDPIVTAMYDLVFGKDVDPLESGTATGSEGDWWTVYALVPDIMEHAVQGFVLYRSPDRRLDGQLRELAQTRAGWDGGSTFVYSQHCKALRGLGMDDAKIAAIQSWPVSNLFSDVERAVLGYVDALVLDRGRCSDDLFAALKRLLSDEEILELTYVTAMYQMHSTITRSLRLEWDDRDDPVHEVANPEDFDAEHYVQVGSTHEAKQQLREVRR